MKTLLVLTAAAVGMIATSSAANTFVFKVSDAFKTSAFVELQFKAGNIHATGPVVVGGNFVLGQNGYQVNNSVAPIYSNSLIVGGNISAASGSPILTVTSGSTAYKSKGANVTLTSSLYAGSPGDATIYGSVTSAFTNLRLLSSNIGKMGGTAVTISGNNFSFNHSAPLVSNSAVMTDKFRVYTVDASQLSSPGSFNNYNFLGWQSDELIVVNVTNNQGGARTAYFNFDIANAWADNILWNIVDGNVTMQLANKSFSGSLLAPNSTFIQNNQTVDGSLVVRNYDGSSNGGELHPITFLGNMTGGVVAPEPTSAFAGVLLVLGFLRRQRR